MGSIFALLLAFWVSFWALPVQAGRWQIKAQKLFYYAETKIFVAEGEVIIAGEDFTVFCQRARYEMETKTVYLWGPLTITTDGDKLEGQRGWLNLETYHGEVENGHLFLRPGRVKALALAQTTVHVLAKRMEMRGKDRYQAEKALITTCNVCYPQETCTPDWSLRTHKIKITPAGKAKAKHLTFNIKKVPVAYSPYVSLSVKAERHSGFLLPRLVHGSREGTGLEWPFFWDINDSLDLTFYPFYTRKRGFMLGLEGNYALTAKDKGTFRIRYLKDRLGDNDYNNDGIIRDNKKRYWITAKIDQWLAPGWETHLDLDILSDRDFLYEFLSGPLGFDQSHLSYLRRFGRGLEEKNTRYRTSRFWLNHPFGHYFLQGSATYHDSQIPGQQDETLQPIPHLYFSRLTAPLWGPFSLHLENDYVYWWREKGYRGHRLDLAPQLILTPNLWAPLDLLASYRLIHTIYWVNWRDSRGHERLTRTLYEIEGVAAVNLSKIYPLYRFGLLGVKHTLRPEIRYFYRPPVNQKALPEFTLNDRLEPVNRLDYGLLQFLTAKKKDGANVRFFDLVRLWVHQSYDFREASRELKSKSEQRRPFSDLYAEGEIRFPGRLYVKGSTSYNFYGLGWVTANLSADLRNPRGEYIGLDYRWDKARNIDQLNFRFRKNVHRGFFVAYRLQYSLKEDEISNSQLDLEYRAQCWWGIFRIYHNPDENRYSFYVNLVGIGGWGR